MRIGPLYAASDRVAEALISGLAEPGMAVAIDVPDVNRPAIKLMESLGFEPTFECARMYAGPAPEIDQDGIFGTTTLELG
jgi:hypothetical protein